MPYARTGLGSLRPSSCLPPERIQTQFVLHDAASLDATHHVLYSYSDAIDTTILFLFFVCQCPATRFLLWLDHHNTINAEALKPHILIQDASCWKLISLTVSCPFVMTCSFPSLSQAPHTSCVICHHDILDRMLSLLSTIVPFLLIWITWAIYWPLCSIVKKKGVCFADFCSIVSSMVCSSRSLSRAFGVMSVSLMRMSRLGRSPCCSNA